MIDTGQLLDSLACAVLALDTGLHVVYMNPAAEMLFETSVRHAAGQGLGELAGDAGTLIAALRRCLREQHPYSESALPLRLHGGRRITVNALVSVLPATADEDRPAGLALVLQQVDQHLRFDREQQLMAQQQISRTLARNLAHEIKNPLGGLRGAAQLLAGELPSAELREYTGVIIGEADRLTGLVDRMLGPKRPPAFRRLNIHEVLQRVRALALAESPGLVIRQDYDPSIPPLCGDPDQLIQALLNIVGNAAQALATAAQDAGVITLRTRVERQGHIGPKRYRLLARVEVSDNGPGIPEELREDIFFPTISGRDCGTGLGLSIAQGIVHLHDGLIECASRPGRTTFTLLLPLEKADG